MSKPSEFLIRSVWADAPLDADVLDVFIDAAHVQCSEYLPWVGAYDITPNVSSPLKRAWHLAVIYQARELWAAAKREGDVIGFDGYAVRVRPLTSTVKALLRPPRAVPRVR